MYDELKVIKEPGIEKYSIPVAGRYEERAVVKCCDKLGVKLIPKSMASIIPIEYPDKDPSEIDRNNQFENNLFVYIDDDKYFRLNWANKAKSAGVKLITFESPHNYKISKTVIPKESTFYIDRDFGVLDQTKGEDFAKELYDQGYRNLYLATAYKSEDIGYLYWLKGIVGKEPPWG